MFFEQDIQYLSEQLVIHSLLPGRCTACQYVNVNSHLEDYRGMATFHHFEFNHIFGVGVVIHESLQIVTCQTWYGLQGIPSEEVTVSNMGVAKKGPVIVEGNQLMLKYTDGSECEVDGKRSTYTTRIHFVCSKRPVVRITSTLYHL